MNKKIRNHAAVQVGGGGGADAAGQLVRAGGERLLHIRAEGQGRQAKEVRHSKFCEIKFKWQLGKRYVAFKEKGFPTATFTRQVLRGFSVLLLWHLPKWLALKRTMTLK